MNTNILRKVADFLESHPDQYDFIETDTPIDASECGCVMGWIGYFMGRSPKSHDTIHYLSLSEHAKAIGLDDESILYSLMTEAEVCLRKESDTIMNWQCNAKDAATCLRFIAEQEESNDND